MRILVVSQYFWPEGFRINEVVRSLVEKGVEVDVLTGKPNYPEGAVFSGYRAGGCQVESWAGTTVYRVPLFPRGVRSTWRLALNYLSFMVMGLVLGPWMLRGRGYDAILVYAPSYIAGDSGHFFGLVETNRRDGVGARPLARQPGRHWLCPQSARFACG